MRSCRTAHTQNRRPERGFTLLEVAVSSFVFAVILLAVGQFFLGATRSLTSLAKRTQSSSRTQVVLDRIVEELQTAKFDSLEPAVPTDSSWIRFQQIVSFTAGSPVYGNPIQIELIGLETGGENDGLDNNQNGLTDEAGVRYWEDVPPLGSTPGAEDEPAFLTLSCAADGLKFTRVGAVLKIEMHLLAIPTPGSPPTSVQISSSVTMRNDG